jgi:Cys-tRNA(Pro)/Cys-tRNA(Cys) deacylase
MSTRAIQYLDKKKISFEVIRYLHEEKGARFASEATGFPLRQTIKTLVVDVGRKNYVLALMPGDRQLDLKKLARTWRVKRAAMADSETAERLTGYRIGGISPFGTRQKMPAVLEESLLAQNRVVINAGQRGTLLKMTPADIVDALGCRVADIGRTEGD